MKNVLFSLAFGLGVTATSLLEHFEECKFELNANGGANGCISQVENGQCRIGGNFSPTTFLLDKRTGIIKDSKGRGCFITGGTHQQIQCDDKSAGTPGWTVENGLLKHDGCSDFAACPVNDSGEWNIYKYTIQDQVKCVGVILKGNCAPMILSPPPKSKPQPIPKPCTSGGCKPSTDGPHGPFKHHPHGVANPFWKPQPSVIKDGKPSSFGNSGASSSQGQGPPGHLPKPTEGEDSPSDQKPHSKPNTWDKNKDKPKPSKACGHCDDDDDDDDKPDSKPSPELKAGDDNKKKGADDHKPKADHDDDDDDDDNDDDDDDDDDDHKAKGDDDPKPKNDDHHRPKGGNDKNPEGEDDRKPKDDNDHKAKQGSSEHDPYPKTDEEGEDNDDQEQGDDKMKPQHRGDDKRMALPQGPDDKKPKLKDHKQKEKKASATGPESVKPCKDQDDQKCDPEQSSNSKDRSPKLFRRTLQGSVKGDKVNCKDCDDRDDRCKKTCKPADPPAPKPQCPQSSTEHKLPKPSMPTKLSPKTSQRPTPSPTCDKPKDVGRWDPCKLGLLWDIQPMGDTIRKLLCTKEQLAGLPKKKSKHHPSKAKPTSCAKAHSRRTVEDKTSSQCACNEGDSDCFGRCVNLEITKEIVVCTACPKQDEKCQKKCKPVKPKSCGKCGNNDDGCKKSCFEKPSKSMSSSDSKSPDYDDKSAHGSETSHDKPSHEDKTSNEDKSSKEDRPSHEDERDQQSHEGNLAHEGKSAHGDKTSHGDKPSRGDKPNPSSDSEQDKPGESAPTPHPSQQSADPGCVARCGRNRSCIWKCFDNLLKPSKDSLKNGRPVGKSHGKLRPSPPSCNGCGGRTDKMGHCETCQAGLSTPHGKSRSPRPSIAPPPCNKCDPSKPRLSPCNKCRPSKPGVSPCNKCGPSKPSVSPCNKCGPSKPSVSPYNKCGPSKPSVSPCNKCGPSKILGGHRPPFPARPQDCSKCNAKPAAKNCGCQRGDWACLKRCFPPPAAAHTQTNGGAAPPPLPPPPPPPTSASVLLNPSSTNAGFPFYLWPPVIASQISSVLSAASGPAPSVTLPPSPSFSNHPVAPASLKPSHQPYGACPADLKGDFQYPHLIIPVEKKAPTKAWGNVLSPTIDDQISSIFNFDIPANYVGKTCSLFFFFPEQKDLSTSSYKFSGSGMAHFDLLQGISSGDTTYANKPKIAKHLNDIPIKPGSSYWITDHPCEVGAKAIEVSGSGGFSLNYFQDYNPAPIGLYIRAC